MQLFRRTIIAATVVVLAACGEAANQDATSRALALSQSQRAELAKHLRSLRASTGEESQTFRGPDIPRQFRYLEPLAVVSSPTMLGVHMSGQFDNKVYIFLMDSEPGLAGRPRGELVLLKGERGGTKVLWQD